MAKIVVKHFGTCPKLPWMVEFHSTTNGKIIPNNQLEAAFAQNRQEHLQLLNHKSKTAKCRLTQYICSITKDSTVENIEEYIVAGMSIAKINSYDHTLKECAELLDKLQKTAEEYSRKVGRRYPLAIALTIDEFSEIPETASEIARDIIKCLIRKSVKIPSVSSDISNKSELVNFVMDKKLDFIIAANVCTQKNVKYFKETYDKTPILSMIQNSEAVDNIDEIIELSDGIILDSESLVNSLSIKICIIQKSIIAKCNKAMKPIYCVVPELELENVSKAELCDIASMIMEGIDGLLINGDINMKLTAICKEAEGAVYQKGLFNYLAKIQTPPSEPIYALALSAVQASFKCNAAAIVLLTVSGRSGKIVAGYRPRCPIIAVTRFNRSARMLQMCRGLVPVFYCKPFGDNWEADSAERIQVGITYGKFKGYIKMGDAIVALTGHKPGTGLLNDLKIVYASEYDTIQS